MTRNKAPKEPFFKIWDKDPEGKAKDISKFNYLRHAATALPAAVNLRGVKKQQLMAAGAFAAAHFAQRVVTDQKNISRMRAILREESRPAPKNVQLTAERLFLKAGLNVTPKVVIVSPQPKTLDLIAMGSTGASLAYTVELAGPELASKQGEVVIMVGEKAHKLLSREELAALLAHETARVWTGSKQKSFTERLIDAGIDSVASGVSLSGMFNRRSMGGIPSMAGKQGRSFSESKIRRLDAERTDRNAVGLFPHPTALKNALAKTEGAMLADMKASEDSVFAKFKKLSQFIEDTRDNATRDADIAKFYNEALDFYRAHKLPLDNSDILPLPAPDPFQKKSRNDPGNKP
jgi:hypothetical protein